MIGEVRTIYCRRNHKISVRVMPGHFVMTHAHTNYYIDLMEAKLNQAMAEEAGSVLAQYYDMEQKIDTIVCLDGSEIIGAFLAQKLAAGGMFSVNSRGSIHVVTPENDEHSRLLLFRDNVQPMIRGKNVLVLCGNFVTGKNAHRAVQCVSYYGGKVVGIAAVFSLADQLDGVRVSSLFDVEDIPDYTAASSADCEMCRKGVPVDALANSYGYSRL